MVKKTLLLFACLSFMLALPLSVAATDEVSFADSADEVISEYITTEVEIPAESEISATETEAYTFPVTEETPVGLTFTVEMIVDYIFNHPEEITVIITMIGTIIYQIKKNRSLGKSMTLMNNNAVAMSENSTAAINQALLTMNNVANQVEGYKYDIEVLLGEVRDTAEQKKKLAEALITVENHLKVAKLANTELANEVAELLVLANIPNSKKDELYARHRAAVALIDAASEDTESEVDNDDGEEA